MRRSPNRIFTEVQLTAHHRNVARIAGGDIIARGIRVALDYWLQAHPRIEKRYREYMLSHPESAEIRREHVRLLSRKRIIRKED